MHLLTLAVLCLALAVHVSGAPPCSAAERCNDEFVQNAHKARNDREIYCVHVRQREACLENVIDLCTPEQRTWVNNQVSDSKARDPECSADRTHVSMVAVLLLSLITYLLTRH